MGRIFVFEQAGPTAGMWQQRSVPANLAPQYHTALTNVMLKQGMTHIRPGVRKLNGVLFGADGNRTMHGMTTWKDSVDGDQIIAAAGTHLQRMPVIGGDPEDLTTAYPSGFAARTGYRTQFVHFNGCLYIVNGLDANVKYNGTTLTKMGLSAPTTLAAPTKSGGGLTMVRDYRARLVSSAANGSQESEPTAVMSVTYTEQQGAFVAPSVPSNDPQVDRWNLEARPQSGALYYRVNPTPVTLATTIGDNLSDLLLQAGTASANLLNNSLPPGPFHVLCEHQGRLVGAIGNRLYYSDQGLDAAGLYFKPDAWPPGNVINFGENGGNYITGLVSFFTSLVIGQDFGAWTIEKSLADESAREIFPLTVAPNSTGVGFADITNVAVAPGRMLFSGKDRIYQIIQNSNALRSTIAVVPVTDSVSALYRQIDYDQGGASVYDNDNKQWVFFGRGRTRRV
jgi:hypothetical protein